MDKSRCSKCNKEINRKVRTVGARTIIPKYCSNCGKAFEDVYSSESEIRPSSK